LLTSRETESVEEIDILSLISRIGTCECFDLVYNQLNARAYPDHREDDFALQIRKEGICTYIELVSRKECRVLEWMLCDEVLEAQISNVIYPLTRKNTLTGRF
jgi:hypothetical protein